MNCINPMKLQKKMDKKLRIYYMGKNTIHEILVYDVSIKR